MAYVEDGARTQQHKSNFVGSYIRVFGGDRFVHCTTMSARVQSVLPNTPRKRDVAFLVGVVTV